MEIVKSFKTSDGALHLEKSAALRRECCLEIAGQLQVLQRNKGQISAVIAHRDAGALIADNVDKFLPIVSKYNRAISLAKKLESQPE